MLLKTLVISTYDQRRCYLLRIEKRISYGCIRLLKAIHNEATDPRLLLSSLRPAVLLLTRLGLSLSCLAVCQRHVLDQQAVLFRPFQVIYLENLRHV